MTTNDIDRFICNNVLVADILGFSKLTLSQPKQAEDELKNFGEIVMKLVTSYEKSKISFHPFSDSVVVGFKEIKDALSFSKTLFSDAFYQGIHLRGTIGIGDFTHIPNLHSKSSFTIGSGLVLATFADKYHVKGHTLLLVCKINAKINFFDSIIFKIPKLSKEFKAYIVPWWEKGKSEELKNEIDKRTHGLDVEKIIYLETTKEHMNYFIHRDRTGDIDVW
ncbi:MAG: hypothetical protein WA102_09055 [Candidatus Methanoperedens sp.]